MGNRGTNERSRMQRWAIDGRIRWALYSKWSRPEGGEHEWAPTWHCVTEGIPQSHAPTEGPCGRDPRPCPQETNDGRQAVREARGGEGTLLLLRTPVRRPRRVRRDLQSPVQPLRR